MRAKDLEQYEQDQLNDKLNLKKTKKMGKMKTVENKGKKYVTVNERLKYFRENFKSYALITEVIDQNQAQIVTINGKEKKKEANITIKATIKDPNGTPVATGLAYEVENSSFINKTSFIENCETSAWGRALANFGIGIDETVASADEVVNAIRNQ